MQKKNRKKIDTRRAEDNFQCKYSKCDGYIDCGRNTVILFASFYAVCTPRQSVPSPLFPRRRRRRRRRPFRNRAVFPSPGGSSVHDKVAADRVVSRRARTGTATMRNIKRKSISIGRIIIIVIIGEHSGEEKKKKKHDTNSKGAGDLAKFYKPYKTNRGPGEQYHYWSRISAIEDSCRMARGYCAYRRR